MTSKKRGRGMLVLILVIGMVGIWLWFRSNFIQTMLFHPPKQIMAATPHGVETLILGGAARVSVWHYPSANSKPNTPVLLLFHGNGENLGTMWESGIFADFHGLGAHVVALDYPGYGVSGGKPNERTVLASADLAVDWVKGYYPGSPVVIVGWSLGAAVGIQVAAHHRVEGMILLSPWSSLRDVGLVHFPTWLVDQCVRGEFDSLGQAPNLKLPVVVIHGVQDTLIPVNQGQRLSGAIPSAEWRPIAEHGHNDILLSGQTWNVIGSFLTRIEKP